MRHFEREENPTFATNLNTKGVKRAGELRMCGVERIVSSPFPRCRQSVSSFATRENIPLLISCALGEYIDDERHGIGLESEEDFERRVLGFIESDRESRLEAVTLYVTHGAVAEFLHGEKFVMGDVRWIEA